MDDQKKTETPVIPDKIDASKKIFLSTKDTSLGGLLPASVLLNNYLKLDPKEFTALLENSKKIVHFLLSDIDVNDPHAVIVKTMGRMEYLITRNRSLVQVLSSMQKALFECNERLTEKETRCETLHQQVREQTEAFRIEWKNSYEGTLKGAVEENKSRQDYFCRINLIGILKNQKDEYEKSVATYEKDRKDLIKENANLRKDKDNLEKQLSAFKKREKQFLSLLRQHKIKGPDSDDDDSEDDDDDDDDEDWDDEEMPEVKSIAVATSIPQPAEDNVVYSSASLLEADLSLSDSEEEEGFGVDYSGDLDSECSEQDKEKVAAHLIKHKEFVEQIVCSRDPNFVPGPLRIIPDPAPKAPRPTWSPSKAPPTWPEVPKICLASQEPSSIKDKLKQDLNAITAVNAAGKMCEKKRLEAQIHQKKFSPKQGVEGSWKDLGVIPTKPETVTFNLKPAATSSTLTIAVTEAKTEASSICTKRRAEPDIEAGTYQSFKKTRISNVKTNDKSSLPSAMSGSENEGKTIATTGILSTPQKRSQPRANSIFSRIQKGKGRVSKSMGMKNKRPVPVKSNTTNNTNQQQLALNEPPPPQNPIGIYQTIYMNTTASSSVVPFQTSTLSSDSESEAEEEGAINYDSPQSPSPMVENGACSSFSKEKGASCKSEWCCLTNQAAGIITQLLMHSEDEIIKTVGLTENFKFLASLPPRNVVVALYEYLIKNCGNLGSSLKFTGVALRVGQTLCIMDVLTKDKNKLVEDGKTIYDLMYAYMLDEIIPCRKVQFKDIIELYAIGGFLGYALKIKGVGKIDDVIWKCLFWRPPDAITIFMALFRVNSDYYNELDFNDKSRPLRDRVAAFCIERMPVHYQSSRHLELRMFVNRALNWKNVPKDMQIKDLFETIMPEIMGMEHEKALEMATDILTFICVIYGHESFPYFRDQLIKVTQRWMAHEVNDGVYAAVIRAIGEMAKKSIEVLTPAQLKPLKEFLETASQHNENSVVVKDAYAVALVNILTTSNNSKTRKQVVFPLLVKHQSKKSPGKRPTQKKGYVRRGGKRGWGRGGRGGGGSFGTKN